MGGTKGDALKPGQVRILLGFEKSSRKRWHQGNQEVEGPFQETSSFLVAPEVNLGLGHRLELGVVLPWATTEAEDESGKDTASGMGDLLTRMYWNGGYGSWRYGLSAGAYWPVASLGKEGLPATATFSSGSVDPSLGGYVSGPSFWGLSWQSSIHSRLVLQDDEEGNKLGSSFFATTGANRSIWKDLSFSLALTYLYREPDTEKAGHGMHGMYESEDTGGHWLYLQPSAIVALYKRPSYALQLMAGGRIPLMQDVEGTQLVESTAFTLGLAQTFNFK